MAVAIKAEGLGKRYLLGDAPSATTLAEHALGALSRRGRPARQEFWAMRDVSFEVEQGTSLGIIGSNGAGKSTLLKVLARITTPTSGRAWTRGTVGALLEVGTAFHRELTGRENISINGALLGMTRRDIAARFDDIVEFAGVGQFLDTPIKRYSSGMYMRLAFAVAAHFEPDIVIVDEVLAVGDIEFQRRCLNKMSEFGESGRTVVFVSHDLGAVAALCQRALWLADGAVAASGPVAEVVDSYTAAHTPSRATQRFGGTLGDPATLAVSSVSIQRPDGEDVEELRRGEPMRVVIDVRVGTAMMAPELAVWVAPFGGARLLDEAILDSADPVDLTKPGRYAVTLDLPPLLAEGDYSLGLWIGSAAGTIADDIVLDFRVRGLRTDSDEMGRRGRLLSPPVRWSSRAMLDMGDR